VDYTGYMEHSNLLIDINYISQNIEERKLNLQLIIFTMQKLLLFIRFNYCATYLHSLMTEFLGFIKGFHLISLIIKIFIRS
jgi:hypothetical protein